ncbi:hypothetical protein [Streptomyces sp.]|uniref:hypothetical protein n=1 Tax=Streptomyces sp. TaxID=1931 RepID=UPI002F925F1D
MKLAVLAALEQRTALRYTMPGNHCLQALSPRSPPASLVDEKAAQSAVTEGLDWTALSTFAAIASR